MCLLDYQANHEVVIELGQQFLPRQNNPHFAVEINERSSAVARINGDIGLQEFLSRNDPNASRLGNDNPAVRYLRPYQRIRSAVALSGSSVVTGR